MVNFPFIKIDVFSDVDFDRNQVYRVGTVTTWDELKTLVTYNINGKTIHGSDSEYANISLKISLYDAVSTIALTQDTPGHYVVSYKCFADPTLVSEVETFLNEVID